jgi:hypothetical protein
MPKVITTSNIHNIVCNSTSAKVKLQTSMYFAMVHSLDANTYLVLATQRKSTSPEAIFPKPAGVSLLSIGWICLPICLQYASASSNAAAF